ncbi:hypothetical protein EST38_g292 [Candolleomyces aberdarensis]|uniref:Uncharacterized protein n=1 Tax=Candolleomyces aberdarensis TaxID=2316362 RepID=A0A4Q2E192_9AGAR|nr:hypothetical protein EST38_g292 [Candolleomyces aberdarensis]
MSLDADLARHEATIQKLESARDDLLRQLEELDLKLLSEKAQYSQLRNHKVAIHALPNELLGLVFGLAHSSLRFDRPDAQRLRFLVHTSWVCTRWRQVILRTPLLWNTIAMTVFSGFEGYAPAQESLLAHLERSGDAYLDMEFFLATDNPKDFLPFFDTIGSHSKRWRRLSVEMNSADIPIVRKVLQNLEVPKLEHFSLNIWETSEKGLLSPRTPYPTIAPQIFMKGATDLCLLRLAGAALGSLHPQSTSIRILHVGGWEKSFFTWAQFRSLLESLPRLENLSLHELCIRHNTRNPLDQPAPMNLPNLRRLRLHSPFTPIDRILPLLSMPKLEQVSLHTLETFESPVMPTVTYLHLNGCAFDDVHYEELFASFPNIQHVSVDEYAYLLYNMLRHSLPPVNDATTAPNSNSNPNPNSTTCPWSSLHTLTVRDLASSEVNVFVEMVRQRKEAQVPIKTVRLDRRGRNVVRLKHKGDQLAEHTSVVSWDGTESWPPGLGYEDPHDLV